MTEREDRQDITRCPVALCDRHRPARLAIVSHCVHRRLRTRLRRNRFLEGADAVTEFMQHAHAMAGHTMHRLTNQVITVDGDSAQARTYVDALIMLADNNSGVNAAGFYDDELVRTDTGMADRPPPLHPGASGSVGWRRHDVCSQVRPVGVGGRRIRRRRRRLRRGACRARGQRRAAGAAPGRARRGGRRDRRPHRRRNPHAGSRSR